LPAAASGPGIGTEALHPLAGVGKQEKLGFGGILERGWWHGGGRKGGRFGEFSFVLVLFLSGNKAKSYYVGTHFRIKSESKSRLFEHEKAHFHVWVKFLAKNKHKIKFWSTVPNKYHLELPQIEW